jgi:hypothetical protein
LKKQDSELKKMIKVASRCNLLFIFFDLESMKKILAAIYVLAQFFFSCHKTNTHPAAPATPFVIKSFTVNGISSGNNYYNLNAKPQIKFYFGGGAIKQSTVNDAVQFIAASGQAVPASFSYDDDSTLNVSPSAALPALSGFSLTVTRMLQSQLDSFLQSGIKLNLITAIDSTDKFPQISDSALLTVIQEQTFKYFYDFGHPVSGLARERNSSGDIVTIGGSGFGVMAILVGIQRNFITRAQGLSRIDSIVSFLSTKAQRYHGAFPHWMNGATGATVPFSTNDNGADLVETSYLLEGLLAARQFFSGSDPAEIDLRFNINQIWMAVEWNWFRQQGQNVLYWHWSPTLDFIMNMPIQGWNEAMIVYALAASSPIDSNRIPKMVYDSGWARNGGMKNGNHFYNYLLPLGPSYGGPLFFAHYSFLGINPNSLTDNYADYWMQNLNHSLINFTYCATNPGHFNGYSTSIWGLTASDDNLKGYDAHSPTNDDGVITPSAAISSLPYTPNESMDALRFFYYKLGDKLWGNYGFVDAFNLTNIWFADSFLAIDQGPEIIMIENYRTGLLWNLFMSCPEIKTGLKSLGFQSPNLN